MNWMVYTVIVREAFEALLIVGILFAVAHKTKVSWAAWSIAAGAGLGLAASVLAAFLILNMPDFVSDKTLLVLEIAFPALAAVMIVYTVWWMHRSVRAGVGLKERAGGLASENRFWSLAAVTGLAVGREGAETVLFLSGEIMRENIARSFYLSSLLAALTSILIYFVVSRSMLRIGYKWFFSISSAALMILACKLVLDTFNQLMSRGFI